MNRFHLFGLIALTVLLGACGSDVPLIEGTLLADAALTAPVQNQPAAIVELKVDVYRSPGGRRRDNSTYCLLAEGARIRVDDKTYYLGLEKSSELNRDAPLGHRKFTSRPFRISATTPEVLPERFRDLHPDIEGYIRLLRKDKPTTLSVPYLSQVRLLEWYYPLGQRVRLRGEIRQDTLFFRPASLRYAD